MKGPSATRSASSQDSVSHSDVSAAVPAQSIGRAIEAVPSTKLVPPRPARRLVPRDALQERLLAVRRQRCVIVQGPAGSGKTSTLVAWRQRLLALDFDVAWLTVAAEDNELTRFFGALLASFAMVDATVVREAALLVGRDHSKAVLERCIITVVHAIAGRARDFVLMIDDAHCLEEPRSHQVLQWLVDYAPPNLHLVFAIRSVLPLSLARLRAQGQVSEFDLRDLRFSPEESERFLRDHLGRIDRSDAEMLHQLTDGWVAGLQLFAVDLKTRSGTRYPRVQVRDATAFASYFEREVLVNLAPDDLDLLSRAAICNRFCASLCATLMQQPHAVASMTSRLARLDSDSLFISQISGANQEAWYRLHPLLREVLLGRPGHHDAGTRQALHKAAWRWFELRGHLDEAVRHAVQAGEAHAAAEVLEGCAIDLMGQGELVQLAGIMRQLPEEEVRPRIQLRMVTAYLCMYARDLDALQVALASLEADQDTMPARERFAVCLLRGASAMQRDDTETVRAMRPDIEVIPHDAQGFAFAGRAHLLAWSHMYDGHFERARAILREAAPHNVTSARRLVSLALEGMSLTLEGHMIRAGHLLREVQRGCALQGAASVDAAGLADGLLGETLYEANEREAVCQLLEPRLDVLERISGPDAALRALVALFQAHWTLGRRTEALACLARLEAYATRNGQERAQAHALALRLRVHHARGETTQAMAVLERLVALGTLHARARQGAPAEIRRVCEQARVEACLHWQDFDGAVSRCLPLLVLTASVGRWAGVATLHMMLAVAEAGRGDRKAARRQAFKGLRLGHRLGLARSLLDASAGVATLLEDLLDDGAPDPVLAFYIRRLLDARMREAPPLRPACGEDRADLLNARERQVLELVAQAMPNKKIARVLGLTTHTVKWHLRKIYGKLGVSERDEAVARMRDLALSAQPTSPIRLVN
ncbi:HTH-type transcriptional regulator MalT [Cupriavidus yeoncheonensis]|uniref:HTH-type transcriptional regulator MalT n=1 Tax=Cupriavidus yeoncheonensis TaxID=1462994 RepID=A0A916J1U3_9BURK|nr:HTH-type transcriptional regulator MalT [Cupriavidus yeoncheonensis]